MPSAEGSEEPVQPPSSLAGSDAPGKPANWDKHSEAFQPQHQYHHHQESISTSASDSADSSPTTTISTVDDSSATEMSPGSSPESPIGKPYLPSFTAPKRRPHTSDSERLQSHVPFPDSHRPTTPGRRPRNLKNLAVNTSGAVHMSRAASTTSLPMASSLKDASDLSVASQSFSKPPSPPKRRPTNLGLTILTPANTQALPQNMQVAVPPTPSFSRPNMLRHFQSSPSLPIHTSSKVLDSSNTIIGQQASSFEQINLSSSLRTDDSEPNFDIPLSKEEKPEAYPNGPICVYGTNLDLYLEPTAEQALDYDVVLNVASEVKNPFDGASKEAEPRPEFRLDGGGGIQYAPRRTFPGVLKATSYGDALSPVIESSPTTPRATPSRLTFNLGGYTSNSNNNNNNNGPKPEYIHVPWEHNTDIVPDLLRLVKSIDDRVNDGKRVLIHCQCGVSRSATLVVAYVIYKNPTMSVQEAYDAVKRKSKWIGPNMNLIMQLQEFRTALLRPMGRFTLSRGLSPISPSLPAGEWGRPGPHSDGVDGSKSPPNTAPLPVNERLGSALAARGDLGAVSPGPSSAPSGIAWPSHDDGVISAPSDAPLKSEDSAYVDPSGHVVPVVKIIDESQATSLKPPRSARERPRSLNLDNHTRHDSGRHIMSPRSAEFAMVPLQPSKDMASDDAFGLMSPTTTEFSRSPLDRDSLLGALGMGPAMPQQAHPKHLSPPANDKSLETKNSKRVPLRPKLSAPSLREQQELQALQSRLEASLTQPTGVWNSDSADAEALMSPRAIEFTQNPFALTVEGTKTAVSMPEGDDPRSPPQKGASPITRNIFDVL